LNYELIILFCYIYSACVSYAEYSMLVAQAVAE
jgi:hypothetical protein